MQLADPCLRSSRESEPFHQARVAQIAYQALHYSLGLAVQQGYKLSVGLGCRQRELWTLEFAISRGPEMLMMRKASIISRLYACSKPEDPG